MGEKIFRIVGVPILALLALPLVLISLLFMAVCWALCPDWKLPQA